MRLVSTTKVLDRIDKHDSVDLTAPAGCWLLAAGLGLVTSSSLKSLKLLGFKKTLAIMSSILSATMKVPIDTLPVELRIKIYELGDISTITETTDDHPCWSRTIILSGILNDKDAVEIAAIQGDDTRSFMCSCIAISGNIPMMKWARSGKAYLNVHTDADAVDDRSMKQIRLTPCPWNYACCRNAVHFGHFKLLQWLHEQGCPWDYWTFESAVHHGNFEMLEWLYQKKCPLEVSIFSYAVERGNLDVMKWLYEHKFPWNESVCASAAMHGNLEILQWLRERGCPWDRETLDNAMCVRNYDLHHWAIWNGCPRHYRR